MIANYKGELFQLGKFSVFVFNVLPLLNVSAPCGAVVVRFLCFVYISGRNGSFSDN